MDDKNTIKHELQNILSGKNKVSHGDTIQAALSYLRRSQKTSSVAEGDKYHKTEETKNLISYVSDNNLWVKNLNFSDYFSEGAEQRVFIKDEKTVYKLNDSICYATWID